MAKRSFYEDDQLIINKPGFNTEIQDSLKEQESSHGNISFIHGMGVRTTPYLEQYINKFRLYSHDKLAIYEAELGTQKTAFVNEMNSIFRSVESTIREPVLPGLIYILTATLTGSIMVNKRSLPVRFAAPLVFGAGATSYFMPYTFETLTDKYSKFERETFPELHQQKQELLIENYEKFSREFCKGINQANGVLHETVHDVRTKLVDLLGDE